MNRAPGSFNRPVTYPRFLVYVLSDQIEYYQRRGWVINDRLGDRAGQYYAAIMEKRSR